MVGEPGTITLVLMRAAAAAAEEEGEAKLLEAEVAAEVAEAVEALGEDGVMPHFC